MNLYTYNSGRFPLKIRKTTKRKNDIKTHEEFMKAMRKLSGSIDDPTFVEPQEIKYELSREIII